VGDAGAVLMEDAHLVCVDVDAVRGEHLGLQQAQPFHPGDNRHIVFAAALLDLQARLGNVGEQRHVMLAGEGRAGPERFFCVGVRRMGGDGRRDQGMAFPVGDELACIGQTVLIAGGVRGGELENRLAEHGAHPYLSSGAGDFRFVVVHIREAGCAAADHLRAGQERAIVAEFRADKLAFNGHHISHEPDVEPQVIGQAAQKGHRHVRVGVDQARHDDLTATLDGLSGGIGCRDSLPGTNGCDGIAFDGNCAIRKNIVALVHGDDSATEQ